MVLTTDSMIKLSEYRPGSFIHVAILTLISLVKKNIASGTHTSLKSKAGLNRLLTKYK
jgi:hypothetical protein